MAGLAAPFMAELRPKWNDPRPQASSIPDPMNDYANEQIVPKIILHLIQKQN